MTEAQRQTNHGGTIIATARALGVGVNELIDMSSNLSPLGMAPGLMELLGGSLSQIGHLPEIDNQGLQGAFAQHFGCHESEVLAGNGTTDFIFALPQLVSCQRAVIVQPTYNDYDLACQRQGVAVGYFHLRVEDDFVLNLDEFAEHLRPGDLVFICNPNNPTGHLLNTTRLHDFIAQHGQCIFVVDESYLPFTTEPSLVSKTRLANLFILCSSSKIYGIPGLRLGFLVAQDTVLQPMKEQMRPWCVNRLAQVAGEYLFDHADGYIAQVLHYLASAKPGFITALQATGSIQVVPGATNFILCSFSSEQYDALWLQEEMLKARIMVRNCVNFNGLDSSYFRLSLQHPQDNAHFLAQLTQIMA